MAERKAQEAPVIREAIFDMDGTILDSMHAWHDVGERYLRSIGIEAEPGLGDKLFTETAESGAIYLVETYGLNMTPEQLAVELSEQMRLFYSTEAEFRPGALAWLDTLRSAGIPMAVLTSTDGYLVRIVLERLGILGYFQGVFSSGDLHMSKGKPEIFQLTVDSLGARPEETAVFEDGLYAIRTANAAGFVTVGIYDEISRADQPAIRAESDYYVTSLEELAWDGSHILVRA